MYKAFQGANGWYVAFERNGTHKQPFSGGNMSKAEAQREAARRNSQER